MISFPAADEYAEFHKGYIAAVANESDAVAVLERQQRDIDALRRLTPEQAGHRYAAGKWSVRAVIGHVADSERVLSYRLLRIARNDAAALPGFDENAMAAHSNADERPLADLVDELALVRASTLALARSLDQTAVMRRGTVNNWSLSARAVAFIIAGHFQHHLNVLRDRYGFSL
jgi:DinB superfamily